MASVSSVVGLPLGQAEADLNAVGLGSTGEV
jgi:hypothetical protein